MYLEPRQGEIRRITFLGLWVKAKYRFKYPNSVEYAEPLRGRHTIEERDAALMPMSLKEEIRLLSMVDILDPLSDEEMEDLAKRAPDTFLDEGDILYSPAYSMERLFILKEGRIQLYELDESGDEITLSVVEDGNVFGEMALTGQSLHGLYVKALTPSTVVSLRREELEDLIRATASPPTTPTSSLPPS
jgi:CRP-like cAMP-binding protein